VHEFKKGGLDLGEGVAAGGVGSYFGFDGFCDQFENGAEECWVWRRD
jgi:hypothetical protein